MREGLIRDIVAGPSYSFCQLGQRANQEDARYPDTDVADADTRVFVVCDGVGGLEDGEVASCAVAHALGEYVSKADLTQPLTHSDFARALGHAYRALDRAAAGRSIATTLTFVCLHGGGAMAAHIGDSRIYHIRPGVGIRYRSSDHSLVNDLVRTGNLTPQQAANDPRGNYITRCMQSGRSVARRDPATVMQITDLADGDYLFLCTDGVLHKLSEETLVAMLGLCDPDTCFTDPSKPVDQVRMQTIADLCADSSDNNTAYLIPIRLAATANEEDAVATDAEEDDVAAGAEGYAVATYTEVGGSVTTKPIVHGRSDLTIDVRPESPSLFASVARFFRN